MEVHTTNVVITHPLNLAGITGEPSGESATRVPLVVKPANVLPQHGLEGHQAEPRGQILTRYTETELLPASRKEIEDIIAHSEL